MYQGEHQNRTLRNRLIREQILHVLRNNRNRRGRGMNNRVIFKNNRRVKVKLSRVQIRI